MNQIRLTPLLVSCGAISTVLMLDFFAPQGIVHAIAVTETKGVFLAFFSALILIELSIFTASGKIKIFAADLALAAFVSLGLLSWAWNQVSFSLALPFLRQSLSLLGYMAAGSVIARNPRTIDRVMSLFLALGILVAVLAVGESLGWFHILDVPRRPVSLLGNRNAVAAFLAVLLPLVFYRLRLKPRGISVFTLILFGVVLLLCRSRGYWVALLGAALMASLLYLRKSHLKIFAGSLFLFALCIGLVNFLPWNGLRWKEHSPLRASVERLFDYTDGTGKERTDQLRLGLAMLEGHYFLGRGPSNWRPLAPHYMNEVPGVTYPNLLYIRTPSSDYVRILSENGVIAFAIYLFLIILHFGSCLKNRRSNPQTAALAFSLLIFFIGGATDFAFFRPPVFCFIGVALGVLRGETRTVFTLSYGKSLKGVTTGLGIALLIMAGLYQWSGREVFYRTSPEMPFLSKLGVRLPLETNNRLGEWLFHPKLCQTLAPEVSALLKDLPYEINLLEHREMCAQLRSNPSVGGGMGVK